MPRPKQRTPALGARVLDAALEVLDADGVRGLTARGVACRADTSVAAVYELFGDKGGLVRAVFFEGFRMLGRAFGTLDTTDDARGDVDAMMRAFRDFGRRHPELADVMFSRPFTDFEPGPEERAAGATVRTFIIGRLQRCIDEGLLRGDATDLAHVALATAQGMLRQENAGWLGRSRAATERRWQLAVDVFFGSAST